jgi:diaminohydroxyphosphoribosylaminopyrimidine deaminase/5-amino-6-(5-phosphoribosylamino)uracil reductase
MAEHDTGFMALALALAERGRGLTSPNPMVGAVVVKEGVVVGRGYHARAGALHAEAAALAEAGEQARGATLYVTLEPCNHAGRTPPCVDAIRRAGIRRVVAAVKDPNPRVPGGGIEALRRAGVEAEVGCLEREARELNRVFFTAMKHLRPHVTLKSAMTLDGKIAATDRSSRWITGPEARREAHRLRSQSDAVIVGIGTALADDPALTVRLEDPWPREPYRVVVDSRARLPLTARLISAGSPERAVVAVADEAPAERVARLEERGVTVLKCRSKAGRVLVEDLAARLFAMDVMAVLVEGGSELNASFVEARLVDRIAWFVAPMILGGAQAPGPVAGHGLPLASALRVRSMQVRQVGGDWLIEGDVAQPGEGG